MRKTIFYLGSAGASAAEGASIQSSLFKEYFQMHRDREQTADSQVKFNSHLVRIWDLSERVLTTADRIIFSGYSLPDADMHIKYLLKRGCLNRSKSASKKIVTNNHRGKFTSLKSVEKYRY